MALNDIKIFTDGVFGPPGSVRHNVTSGQVASINAGELVIKILGSAFVRGMTTTANVATALKPSVTSDFIAGIATSTSTDTASAAGTVDVIPNVNGMTYLVAPLVAATWDTQAKYDALVGDRDLLNVAVTTGITTMISGDSANNGCVIEPLDIAKHPGLVRFSLRKALNYTA